MSEERRIPEAKIKTPKHKTKTIHFANNLNNENSQVNSVHIKLEQTLNFHTHSKFTSATKFPGKKKNASILSR